MIWREFLDRHVHKLPPSPPANGTHNEDEEGFDNDPIVYGNPVTDEYCTRVERIMDVALWCVCIVGTVLVIAAIWNIV